MFLTDNSSILLYKITPNMKINFPLTLGILGGGQLAKMMSIEAYRLGMNVAIIENGENTPAGDMTKLDFPNGWNDKAELDRFIAISDVITLENEFINPDILRYVEQFKPVFPSASTLELIQDKFVQKTTFADAGLPVAKYRNIQSKQDLFQFGEEFGYPFVAKSRKMGYDGYGNYTLTSIDDIDIAWEKFQSNQERSSIYAEEFIRFDKELAIMIARNQSGEVAIYPVVETIQRNHICNEVKAPADIPEYISDEIKNIAKICVETINGVGIFGIEFFLRNNSVIINEIAPRPHNTGHYTIEACLTSQFENAIRAVANFPLGSTEMILPGAAMINLLGERDGVGAPANIDKVLSIPNAFLHLYNKKESRKGRKMGHITVIDSTPEKAYHIAMQAKDVFDW